MVYSQQLHLVLFFTRENALKSWIEWGSFEREVALYLRLQKHGINVSFLTYGDDRDLRYAHLLPDITILCNRWRLPRKWYERLLPLLHARYLRNCDVIKTNQTNGADVALRTAHLWRKPLIARCGYMWSEFAARDYGENSRQAKEANEVELKSFSRAAKIVVTTPQMAASVKKRVPGAASRITVIPNYVDTRVFSPRARGVLQDLDLIFVGRLTPQKNLLSLIDAVQITGTTLGVIGAGSQHQEELFQNKIAALNGNVQWLGKNVPNHELPNYINRAKIYILPSHFEGHPKTLIEAMACGLPVIGADSPGITEVIEHGETGYLCGTDPNSIGDAIKVLLSDFSLREYLGRNARQYVMEHYSLDRIVDQELHMLEQVASRAKS